MSKTAHDQYIDADEEEETCPLCIEDFDLTDKGFKPCPCGYQICQFCYNSIKNNMNGLCPACRRPYDDKSIEYKLITPEETAAYRARQAQKQKKTQAAQQKEKQKAEADSLSRKHLAGLRVVQKNLVYVTGIAPKMQEDELLQTLRGDKYFGRYGKIIKIVISKARDKHDSVGVYVTYERKDDAANCIAAVDGFISDDRTLRAQFGTTKYCSAYLRGDSCMNRNCMFLHEPGEAKDSYSRADLSALNAGGTQNGEAKPPPPQSQQPVSAAQPMTRQSSDAPSSPTTSDRPALPSTASWASKPPTRNDDSEAEFVQAQPSLPQAVKQTKLVRLRAFPLQELLKKFDSNALCLSFSTSSVADEDIEIIDNYPALFDGNGGERMRLRKQRDDAARRAEVETAEYRATSDIDNIEETPEMSGSLQLGGEPEENQAEGYDQRFAFDNTSDHGMTPQQMLLENLKSSTPLGSSFSASHPPGHHRNVSRFSFANDTASASSAVKPVANPKALNQQSAMMPPTGYNQAGTNFFTTNVQGPPPGLKTTGTPPVSGGMTFGQGHGFTTGGLPYVAGTNRNEEMMRDLLRNRGAEGATKLTDEEFPPLGPVRQASISSTAPVLVNETRRSTPALPPGLEESISSRKGTPTVSSKIGEEDKIHELKNKLIALPELEGNSRPSSRASLRRVISAQIVPAIPLRTATPAKGSQPGTPARLASRPASPAQQPLIVQDTPTKKGKGRAVGDQIGGNIQQDTVDLEETKMVDVTNTPDGQVRRQHPGKLDITAAVKQQQETLAEAIEPLSMAQRIAAQVGSSHPASPSATSPALAKAPRTIRLVQTPKTEVPPAPVVAPALASLITRKLPSRQPSIASMNMPGTPTSEQVSNFDNISITSTSQSRANSPPPAIASKVGTAPVRTKTKSQLKKERHERARTIEEVNKVEPTVEEPLQEAIIGRKKKTKGQKEVKPKTKIIKDEDTGSSTPTITRPATPVEKTPSPVEAVEKLSPTIVAGQDMSPPATPTLSPAQIISEILSLDPTYAKSIDALFRLPTISNTKNAQSIPAKDIESHASWRLTEFGIKLGKEDVNKLMSGHAATLGWGGSDGSIWSRAMVTPGGAQLRALPDEIEQRYLELEKHIMDTPEELRFRPTKPQNETRFPNVDLKALKKAFDSKGSRGVSVMEQMAQDDASGMKKGAFLVDEVSKYINEFVMPPATPPPSAGKGAAGSGQQVQTEQMSAGIAGVIRDMPVQPIEIADRQLHDARRAVDERESALKRVIRKNKKLLGLG